MCSSIDSRGVLSVGPDHVIVTCSLETSGSKLVLLAFTFVP